MRYFNTVLFTVALVFAISFGWSLHPDVSWWGAIDYILHGSAVGWLFSVGLSLPILLGSRRLPVRTWLKAYMAIVPTFWLGLTLALRGEWAILAMIAVETAIIVLLATPRSPKSSSNSDKTPGAMRERVKGWFIQPPASNNPTTTNTP